MRKLARFLLFALMFASVIGLVISTLQSLVTQQPPTAPALLIIAYGMGVLSVWVFLTTGDAKTRIKRG